MRLLSRDQIVRNCMTIRKAGKKMDELIHQTGVSVIAHAEKHGDTTLIDRLFSVMPKSSRAKALKTWIEDFGPVSWDEDLDRFKLDKEKKARVNEAAKIPFWEYTQESKPLSPLDLEKRLKLLFKQANKVVNQGSEEVKSKSNIPQDLLKKIENILA